MRIVIVTTFTIAIIATGYFAYQKYNNPNIQTVEKTNEVKVYTSSTTDFQDEINQIKAQTMNVGKVIEGLTGGRITNVQIGLALDAITAPGIKKEQALNQLKNLKDILFNKQENVIMGGMPEEQKQLIYQIHGIKPAWMVLNPPLPENKAGHKLDIEESIKRGGPVYAPR